MLRFVVKIGLFAGLLAIFLEIFFRIVVPSSNYPDTIQNQKYRVMQYDVKGPTEGMYTNGRRAQHQSNWRINNLGWISAEDYTLKSEKSLSRAVIIGNSYVEAIYMDVEKHLAPRTQNYLDLNAEVFTLGAWGVDLSQGITVTDYARETLGPELVIFVVSHGSLRRSVKNLANRPFCLQVEFDGDKSIACPPRSFQPGTLGRILKMSSIMRYIRVNARFALGGGAQEESAFIKKTLSKNEMTPKQIHDQELMNKGAHWIIANLKANNPNTQFLFIVDADRNVIHEGKKPQPIPAASHIADAIQIEDNFQMLDLTETMWSDYQRNHRPLHSEDNYHWNEYSVEIIAKSLSEMIMGNELLLQ